jgi:hypothetical protein
MSTDLIIQIIFGIWLIILSLAFFWIIKTFQKLTKEVKEGNLINVLNKIIATESKNSKGITALKKEIKRIDDESKIKVQKVGLIRFNPFSELGGDHSFSLALLDGNDTGIIITGLHTRERTRVYIKRIEKGKSRYDLSKEENRALTKALKGK